MTKQQIKSISLSDDETLEILHSLARQAGAEPKEVIQVLLKEAQKSGRPVRVQKVWTLKSLFEHWRKEEGEAFVSAPLSGDLVKQVVDALKTRLKDTEVALRESDSNRSAPSLSNLKAMSSEESIEGDDAEEHFEETSNDTQSDATSH